MTFRGRREPIPNEPIHKFLLRNVATFGHVPAVIDSATGKTFSYREFEILSKTLARNISEVVKKGDVVDVCLAICPEYIIAVLGCSRLGVIVSGVNPQYTEYELKSHFEQTQPKLVFTTSSTFQKIRNTLPNSVDIYVNDTAVPTNAKDFGQLLRNPDSLSSSRDVDVIIDPANDVAFLPFSSGTTGAPKGVMLTHRNLIVMTNVLRSDLCDTPSTGNYFIHFLPMFHIYGFIMFMSCFRQCATILTMPKYHPETLLKLMQQYKVKFLAAVPSMLPFLAKSQLVAKYDISSLRTLFVTGGTLRHSLSEDVMKRLPKLQDIIQSYGMTETAGPTHLSPIEGREREHHGSIGVVAPNCEAMVIDVNNGSEIQEPNKSGEILVRTAGIMKGYWKNAAATEEAIDKDGWFHSGDVGYFNEDGYFYVVDRIKELIKVKGFQVSPAELEDILVSHVAVDAAAVIGFPHSTNGETPKAFVVINPNHPNVHAEELMRFANEKVVAYKHISEVIVVDELPKTAGGKVLRRQLRDSYLSDAKNRSKNEIMQKSKL